MLLPPRARKWPSKRSNQRTWRAAFRLCPPRWASPRRRNGQDACFLLDDAHAALRERPPDERVRDAIKKKIISECTLATAALRVALSSSRLFIAE